MARDLRIPGQTRERPGLGSMASAAKVISTLAFAALWFAALVLASAVVVIAMLDA